jgi:hypothetical protein
MPSTSAAAPRFAVQGYAMRPGDGKRYAVQIGLQQMQLTNN